MRRIRRKVRRQGRDKLAQRIRDRMIQMRIIKKDLKKFQMIGLKLKLLKNYQ